MLDFHGVSGVDASAVRMLRDLRAELSEHGVSMLVCGCDAAVTRVLERSALLFELGDEAFFSDVSEAVEHASGNHHVNRRLDRGRAGLGRGGPTRAREMI